MSEDARKTQRTHAEKARLLLGALVAGHELRITLGGQPTTVRWFEAGDTFEVGDDLCQATRTGMYQRLDVVRDGSRVEEHTWGFLPLELGDFVEICAQQAAGTLISAAASLALSRQSTSGRRAAN